MTDFPAKEMGSDRPIHVLVVDDSAVMRRLMTSILTHDRTIRVTTASDPIIASRKMEADRPDVILLDIEMPRMDGLTFLRRIMDSDPIPTVICSRLAHRPDVAMEALRLGAVEVITKPELGIREFLEESAVRFLDVLKAAAGASVSGSRLFPRGSARRNGDRGTCAQPMNVHAESAGAPAGSPLALSVDAVAIGISTGGPQSLSRLLPRLPTSAPPLLIVQHMPAFFTAALAKRLNGESRIRVTEARQDDELVPGVAFVAPGDRHMVVHRQGARLHVRLLDGPLVSRHRPSVDVLFRSMAKTVGSRALGLLMTGMGSDGVGGLAAMRAAGGRTAAQDEASSVVYGMPKAAIETGAAQEVVSLDEAAGWILSSSGLAAAEPTSPQGAGG